MKINIKKTLPAPLQFMEQLPIWVCFESTYNEKKKKYSKVPKSPKTGYNARSNNPGTWDTYNRAVRVAAQHDNYLIGVALPEDRTIIGIDFDHCLDSSGAFTDKTAEMLYTKLNTYTEVSPSGNGLRMFAVGSCSATGEKKVVIKSPEGGGTQYEFSDHNSFLTVTGNVYGSERPVADVTGTLDGLILALRGETVQTEENIESVDFDLQIELQKALDLIDPDCSYDVWYKVAAALKNCGMPFEMFDSWSAKGSKYNENTGNNDTRKKWDSFELRADGLGKDFILRTAGVTGAKTEERPASYTATELMAMQLPPVDWIIKNLMPVGVGIIAAPPKAGKSWLVLGMGCAIASGWPFFGYESNKSNVLYLALEDSKNRLKSRLQKLCFASTVPEGLHLATEAQRLDEELLQQLGKEVKANSIKLIIIDTLQMVKPPTDRTKTAYEQDYSIIRQLKTFSKENRCGVLLVHHTRKSNGYKADPFETIHGSVALFGATDYSYVLEAVEGSNNHAVFHMTGRDIDREELRLEFQRDFGAWRSQGRVEDIERKESEEIYRAIHSTILAKFDEAEKDEFYITAGDFQEAVFQLTGKEIGSSPKSFMNELKRFTMKLNIDGIGIIKPDRGRTRNGKRGKFYKIFKSI